jgi:hypothetical protein
MLILALVIVLVTIVVPASTNETRAQEQGC